MINFKSLIEAVSDSVNIANESLLSKHHSFFDTYFYKDENGNFLAKTVPLKFPIKGQNGEEESISINAPLITLVPIYTPKIDHVKFVTNLEVAIQDEELMISFAKESSFNNFIKGKKGPNKSSTKLEIVMKPGESSEGLKNIIEGYEKVLRAQIPG